MTDEQSVLRRLIRSLGPFGFVAVDPSRVNLDDMMAPACDGRIVRVIGDPSTCIAVFAPADALTLGCVAGWISDDEDSLEHDT